MIPDPKLIEGCLQGKRKAYALLYKRYAAIMLGVCLRYGRNLVEAEDVLQEGFIKVFTNLDKFRQEGSLEGWIRRIMVNTAVDHYNKQAKEGFLVSMEGMRESYSSGETGEEEENIPVEDLTEDDLMKMIQNLPDGYRLVFNMYAIEGYSHQEIADKLNISVNTSKTQLFKARRMLRKVILHRSLDHANKR
jgi:RNA polymerase sigma-70 factor (ECF subfamily)